MIWKLIGCMIVGVYAVELRAIVNKKKSSSLQCCDVFDLDVVNVCPIRITPGIPCVINVRLSLLLEADGECCHECCREPHVTDVCMNIPIES